MKKLAIVVAMTALGLGGCAGNDYKLYAETQQKIAEQKAEVEKYKAQAEAERYRAMAQIAENGDSTAKVAAVISLNAGSGNVVLPQREQQIAQPESMTDKIMDWTARLFPSAVSIWGIHKNSEVAMHNSDNSTSVRLKEYDTMVDLVHGETIVTDPIVTDPITYDPVVIVDGDGNESVVTPDPIITDPVYPIVDRP